MTCGTHWCLVFVISLVGSQAEASALKPIVFYDPLIDHIEVLNNDTFDDLIYDAPRATFLEFYANWCARCQRFSPVRPFNYDSRESLLDFKWFSPKTVKQIAKATRPWHKNILRVAAVDCAASENVKLCRQHNIEFYPTFHMFEANAPKGIMGVEGL
jgi:hypothetical protein